MGRENRARKKETQRAISKREPGIRGAGGAETDMRLVTSPTGPKLKIKYQGKWWQVALEDPEKENLDIFTPKVWRHVGITGGEYQSGDGDTTTVNTIVPLPRFINAATIAGIQFGIGLGFQIYTYFGLGGLDFASTPGAVNPTAAVYRMFVHYERQNHSIRIEMKGGHIQTKEYILSVYYKPQEKKMSSNVQKKRAQMKSEMVSEWADYQGSMKEAYLEWQQEQARIQAEKDKRKGKSNLWGLIGGIVATAVIGYAMVSTLGGAAGVLGSIGDVLVKGKGLSMFGTAVATGLGGAAGVGMMHGHHKMAPKADLQNRLNKMDLHADIDRSKWNVSQQGAEFDQLSSEMTLADLDIDTYLDSFAGGLEGQLIGRQASYLGATLDPSNIRVDKG